MNFSNVLQVRGWNERTQRELSNEPIKRDFKKHSSPSLVRSSFVRVRLHAILLVITRAIICLQVEANIFHNYFCSTYGILQYR